MTVQEWFEAGKIMREDIDEMADESEYHVKAAQFIGQKWDYEVDDLTAKQSDRASRILDDMIERRINAQRSRAR